MKKSIALTCLMAMALGAQAQQGGITQDMLSQMKSSYEHTAADKAIVKKKWFANYTNEI